MHECMSRPRRASSCVLRIQISWILIEWWIFMTNLPEERKLWDICQAKRILHFGAKYFVFFVDNGVVMRRTALCVFWSSGHFHSVYICCVFIVAMYKEKKKAGLTLVHSVDTTDNSTNEWVNWSGLSALYEFYDNEEQTWWHRFTDYYRPPILFILDN